MHYDELLPFQGEKVSYLGPFSYNLTLGKEYTIYGTIYTVVCNYQILIEDDYGIKSWQEIVNFNYTD